MTSVDALLSAARRTPDYVVPWGQPAAPDQPGVYLVALTPDPGDDVIERVSWSHDAAVNLLGVRPELTIDGRRPTAEELLERMQQLWVPGQPVVYVGLATTSVRQRVGAYYQTKLGARSPHAGGWPLKLLADPQERLWVHTAAAVEPATAEATILKAFMDRVPAQVRVKLRDPRLPLPYANVEVRHLGQRLVKDHGVRGAKGPQ